MKVIFIWIILLASISSFASDQGFLVGNNLMTAQGRWGGIIIGEIIRLDKNGVVEIHSDGKIYLASKHETSPAVKCIGDLCVGDRVAHRQCRGTVLHLFANGIVKVDQCRIFYYMTNLGYKSGKIIHYQEDDF